MILPFDTSWTLFLDRDGVINERPSGSYVRDWDEFVFVAGVPKAMETLALHFGRILVVTNQQGIGKGLMSLEQLQRVHKMMKKTITLLDGRIDGIYFCPDLAASGCDCRKPNGGMAIQAQRDFPDIDFTRSVIVGDSASDILFGKRLGMRTVFIDSKGEPLPDDLQADATFKTLSAFADFLKKD